MTNIIKHGQILLGQYTIQALVEIEKLSDSVHVAIGVNKARADYFELVNKLGKHTITVIHPEACISPSTSLGTGSFVAAKAVTGPDTHIGQGTIINHGAVVDHDCDIGSCCHIAPNATLGGGVKVGDGVLVGSGAVILPGITVGENTIVGAGAVVTTNIGPGLVIKGVPARSTSE